jgi:methyltransferase (TIGR00027 family)
MTEQRPSSTAIGAAMLRAAHCVIDEAPLVLNDPLALPLSGLPGEAALRVAVARIEEEFAQHCDADFAKVMARDLRATITLRNRYAEDRLREAVERRGLRQYVMLGAGLDSFAHRSELAGRLEIYELDLPASQAWKRAQVQRLGLAAPAGLRYVEVDFERQAPLQALAGSGFRADEPALFSWLGVTGYLSEAAVYSTLRGLAGAAPGSQVVFSYGLHAPRLSEQGRRLAQVLKIRVAARDEPVANQGFDPAVLMQRLREMGYAGVEDLDVAGAQARYFAGRRDGLQAPPMNHMMCATVGATARG